MMQKQFRRAIVLSAIAVVGVREAQADALVWANPSSGLFNDATNWLPSQSPTAADDAAIVFGAAAAPFTVSVPTATTAVAKSIYLDAPSATLAVDGSLTTTAFTLLSSDVTGTVNIADQGTLTFGSITSVGPTRRVFTNAGSLQLATTITPTSGNPSAVTIDLATELRFRAGVPTSPINTPQGTQYNNYILSTNAADLVNRGTVTFEQQPGSQNTNAVVVDLGSTPTVGGMRYFDNQGVTNLQTGRSVTQTGNLTILGGVLNRPHAVMNISAGTLVRTGDSATSSSTFSNQGIIHVAGGGAIFTNAFNQYSGTLDLAAASSISTTRFDLLGGTITGTLNLNGSSSATTVTLGTGNPAPINADIVVSKAVLAQATAIASPNGGDIPAGTTLTVRANRSQTEYDASLTVTNRNFANNGTLTFDRSDSAVNGTSGASLTLGADYLFTNYGRFNALIVERNPSSFPTAAQQNVTGRMYNAPGASFVLGANSTLTQTATVLAGDAALINAGTMTLAAGTRLSTPSFRQTGGSLTVAGAIATDRFELKGGTVTGELDLASSSSLSQNPMTVSLPTAQPLGLHLTLRSGANLTASDGSANDLVLSSDAVLTFVTATSSFTSTISTGNRNITNFGEIRFGQARGTFSPNTLSLGTAGNGLINHGTITVIAGTTQASTGGAIVGKLRNAADGTIALGASSQFNAIDIVNDGVFDLASSATLNQFGSTTSTLTNNGTLNVGPNAHFYIGQLLGRGDLNITGSTFFASFAAKPQSAGKVTSNSDFYLPAGATFTIDRLRASGRLYYNTTGAPATSLILRPDGTAAGVSRVSSLVLGQQITSNNGVPNASLDIADNLVVLDGPAQFDSAVALRANGLTGPGLRSSTVATNPRLAIGIVKASQLFPAGSGTFLGQSVAGDNTLIRTTLKGDATLDATVNFDDLIKLAQNYNATVGKTWADGDFNYDGIVNFDDLIPLAQNYNQKLVNGTIVPAGGSGSVEAFVADWALAQSLVPEPATMLASTPLLFLTRRRRS